MLYSICLRTANTTLTNSLLEINTVANVGCKIYEIGISNTATTACIIALGNPSTASITPTLLTNGWTPAQATASGFCAEQDTGAPVAKTQVAVAWGTVATIANPLTTPMYRRAVIQPQIQAGVIWEFPKGLFLPPNSVGINALCLFNCLSGVALDVWIVIDE